MAKFKPAPLFQSVSGALNKINKKDPHASDQKMVLTTHRTAPTKTKNGCQRVYVRGIDSVTRSTPYGADELARQTAFGTTAQQVNARLKETSPTYDADFAAFLAQKDSKTGEPTFRSYLWKICRG